MSSDTAYLSADNGYAFFQYLDQTIMFLIGKSIQKFIRVKEWDDGYIVVDEETKDHHQRESCIDLRPILDNLYMNGDDFLKPIKKVEVKQDDRPEIVSLIPDGQNHCFEDLKAESGDLRFTVLEEAMRKSPGIKRLTDDVLKSMGLISPEQGFNRAAEILSDSNPYPGITAVRFGDTENIIRKRLTAEHSSVISEIREIADLFETFYVCDEINGTFRERVESIPMGAFREALANAVIHRTWDVPQEITVLMYDDRVEITSPGGLPPHMSAEHFLGGGVSIPRNRILSDILRRIGIAEKPGTGLRKIRSLYRKSERQPVFDVMPDSVRVTLPVMGRAVMTEDERAVFSVLSRTAPLPSREIAGRLPFGRSKAIDLLKRLVEKRIAAVEGSGRGRKYRLR